MRLEKIGSLLEVGDEDGKNQTAFLARTKAVQAFRSYRRHPVADDYLFTGIREYFRLMIVAQ